MNWTERDQKVIWHPYTQMLTAAPPIPIVRGEGALLFDDEGKAYLDAVSSWWVNIHGHAHPFI
ncbi:MAG: aminotransferase class III-fold pyridoxal phosphate-dependent enzyme, partial [Sphingobacteriaceae bacterium]